MQQLFLVVGALVVGDVKVLGHRAQVVAPLALECRGAPFAVGRQVVEEQLPAHRAAAGRDARPAEGLERREVDHLGVEELLELEAPLLLARERGSIRVGRVCRFRSGDGGAARQPGPVATGG